MFSLVVITGVVKILVINTAVVSVTDIATDMKYSVVLVTSVMGSILATVVSVVNNIVLCIVISGSIHLVVSFSVTDVVPV